MRALNVTHSMWGQFVPTTGCQALTGLVYATNRVSMFLTDVLFAESDQLKTKERHSSRAHNRYHF